MTARGAAAARLEAVRISDTLHAEGLSRADADALAAAVAAVAPATVGRWRAKARGLARISHQGHGLRRFQAFDPPGADRKAYRGIRLRSASCAPARVERATRAGAWARPEGRRPQADSVRHGASPMHHIAVRAVPTLSAGRRRADHDHGEQCGLAPGRQLAALMDRKRTGRPPLVDGAVRETLEALARRFGGRLTARLAQRTLVARCGRAPALSTIRHWLARYRREHARAPGAGAPADTVARRPT